MHIGILTTRTATITIIIIIIIHSPVNPSSFQQLSSGLYSRIRHFVNDISLSHSAVIMLMEQPC
jgi:hypothetical protein